MEVNLGNQIASSPGFNAGYHICYFCAGDQQAALSQYETHLYGKKAWHASAEHGLSCLNIGMCGTKPWTVDLLFKHGCHYCNKESVKYLSAGCSGAMPACRMVLWRQILPHLSGSMGPALQA